MLLLPLTAALIIGARRPTHAPALPSNTEESVTAVATAAVEPGPVAEPRFTNAVVVRSPSAIEPQPTPMQFANQRDVAAVLPGIEEANPKRSAIAHFERPAQLDLSFLAASKRDPNDTAP